MESTCTHHFFHPSIHTYVSKIMLCLILTTIGILTFESLKFYWNCIFKLSGFLCAGQCKECKNFNSMFAIVSGLGHGAVSRLRSSWEKLPSKYQRLFSDLQDLMDPSRNMSKYRQLVSSEQSQPPIVSHVCFCTPLGIFILCVNSL
jgi:hypothetical protein